MDEELHDHDRGLSFDLSTLIERRRLFTLFAGAGLGAVLASCGSDSKSSATSNAASQGATATDVAAAATTSPASSTAASSSASTTAAAPSGAALDVIPEETAGPFPGDGSNGINALSESGIVRRDITSSFGTGSTVVKGVPTTIKLTLVDANGGAPLPGAAVYVWHCDAAGLYSMYSHGVTSENYLRGVQEADANGVVTFTSIFPGCYAGRWPHIHYEIYPSVAAATSASSKLATSQLALTKDASAAVYAAGGYPQSTQNLSQVSLSTDMVFSDGADQETPTTTGSVTDGYTIALTAAIKA